MSRLRGVIAATPTPIAEDRGIDVGRLLDHCRWLLEEGGCDGINLLGTTGEATSLSVAQRLETMRAVASSGLPMSRIMVGTGAAALEDAVSLATAARDLGFAGALLLPPFYYKGIGGPALVSYVESLIERVGADRLRIYLYHIPQNTGVPWPIETVTELRNRFPEIVAGLKDSAGDLDYARALARLEGFDVFPGSEGSLGENGFAGCISATTNVTGPLAQVGWRKLGSEEGRAAIEDADRIRNALRLFPLVSSVKWALAELKGDPNWRRTMPPLDELSVREAASLRVALSRTPYSALTRRLP